jgi:predicted ribosome quality control (RQC) complex YloA/Tae2 family protein
MTAHEEAPRGLSATELAAAVAELTGLVGRIVLDITPLAAAGGGDDLLVVFDGAPKTFLLVAPGGTRARICTTALRFSREERKRGIAADVLVRELVGAHLTSASATSGERRCTLTFSAPGGPRTLAVELFGARGLWALLDADGRAVALSREVVTAVRTLRPNDRYEPPPPHAVTGREPPPRFAAPVLATIDAHYAELDRRTACRDLRETVQRAAERLAARAAAKAAGLTKQLAEADAAHALREQADLMLAYAHGVRRGSDRMTVYDPVTGDPRELPLDPARPVTLQAQALYDKARRLTDGRAITEQRLAAARDEEAAARAMLAALPPSDADGDDDARRATLDELCVRLRKLGALPREPKAAGSEPRTKPRPKAPPPGENFRRFVSAEGYPILVGRNNEQNDRLTMKVANGNDLWLHVGGGRPGSHVVIKLPKGKTASLESLLDAAALAVHFSKARGERRVEVVYTHKKNVRKPKGLPAGAVAPSQTKTVTSQLDEVRLRRILDTGGADQE